jgi:cellulose synthase/poly-beta-1,6-N-acetylglucosamine synthase-like glycosyltransferase
VSDVRLIEFLRYFISLIGLMIQIPISGVFLYFFLLSIRGWFWRKETPADSFAPSNRFALLVPAHNEENVVVKIVDNLLGLHYPRQMFDIYVIADNCTDGTARAARIAGAIVLERNDPHKKGKGYAIEWALDQLFRQQVVFDAVCIFDADNLMSSNFLSVMNAHLCQGHGVIQGYLDSKNPFDSWVSANNSISFWIGNRMLQLSRYYLGLSCVLGGTGMVISKDILREIGWEAGCLTEDLEFTLKSVLHGEKVYWAHEAVLYDEKPQTMQQSMRQRVRWMQGHGDCISKYFGQLLSRSIRNRDFVAFDMAVYLIQPVFVVINCILLLLGSIFFLAKLNIANSVEPYSLLSIVLMIGLLYVNGIFLFLDKKASLRSLAYFLTFPLYNLTWAPIILKGFMNRKRKEWTHTLHIRALDIRELERLGEAQ